MLHLFVINKNFQMASSPGDDMKAEVLVASNNNNNNNHNNNKDYDNDQNL